MVFIVGVTYDLASTLELKSKGLPYVEMFLNSDVLLLLSLPLYITLLKINIALHYGKTYAYIISIYLNYHS